MNTDTQKPSEHAMRAAKEWCMPQAKLPVVDSLASCIDQHAIAPAMFELHEKLTKRYQESLSKCHARLEERDKRIAELVNGKQLAVAWISLAKDSLKTGKTDDAYYQLCKALHDLAKHGGAHE